MQSVKERFLRYVKMNTQSQRDVPGCPSTPGQFDLARILAKELEEIGLAEISLDEHCYLMATVPATSDRSVPVIGFISHLDTAPDMSGENVKPQIIPAYDGGEIVLNNGLNVRIKPEEFPELQNYVGQELITTDGTTLLGADDKAGIAIIMTAMEYLVNHPEIPHGKIRVGFTPDEEIGHGADLFDVNKFGAEFAYTVDGGEIGELEFETFNAAKATVIINGRSVHPGSAKNKMINSILVGMELNAMLPVNERPEFTEGREGYSHLHLFSGTAESSKMKYIFRDHDRKKFERKKSLFMEAVNLINLRYGENTAVVEMKDEYYNMREKLELDYHIVDVAREAMEALGIQPAIIPVRGGTDGARLSFMGLPCPNIFTGGMFMHGKYECIPTKSLECSVDVVLKIIDLVATK